MNPETILSTSRIDLLALRPDQLAGLLVMPEQVAGALGITFAPEAVSENAKRAIGYKLERIFRSPHAEYPWHTYWLVVRQSDRVALGLIGFKGTPSERGQVEVGYGLAPAGRGQGYMTEAVQRLAEWAFRQPGCTEILAATEPGNRASQQVLARCGFRKVGESGGEWIYTLDRPAGLLPEAPVAGERPAAYRIETERLVLRCWNPTDAPLLKSAIDASVDHLRPFMPWARQEPAPVEPKVQRMRDWRSKFDRDEEYTYGVFDPREQRVLGGCGLHRRIGPDALEIGYWIHAAEINQGFATELSAALTRVGFEVLGLERMEIHCDPRNLASAAVPRKLGYTLDGVLRGRLPDPPNPPRDRMDWSLLRGEYPATPAAQAAVRAYDAAGRRVL